MELVSRDPRGRQKSALQVFVGHGKWFGFYYKYNKKPLEEYKQRQCMFWPNSYVTLIAQWNVSYGEARTGGERNISRLLQWSKEERMVIQTWTMAVEME